MSPVSGPALSAVAGDVAVVDRPAKDRAVAVKRSLPRLIASLVREPLSSIPDEAYDHPMVVTRALGRMRVYLTGPEAIQEAFVRQADRLSKGEANRVLEPALGGGLLTADGAHWRWQRRSLSPGFAHARLQSLAPAMIAAAEAMRDALLAAPDGPVDIGREATRVTLRIVGDTMLACAGDLEPGRIERGLAAFLAAIPWSIAITILGAPRWTPYPGRRRSAVAADELRAEVLRAVVARRAAAGDDGDDLMALLLGARDPETGRGFSDTEITDNVVTFVTAGHETTSVALTWALQLLALDPQIAARVRAEIDAVVGGEPLDAGHLARLDYTRQVLSETMRLYAPAPVISRNVVEPFDLCGEHLAKGTVLILPIYSVHRHRRLWDRPDVFDPERFAPDAARARHRYAFLPFGLGPRVCIGSAFAMLEATAILAVLVRALDFSAETPAPDPTARLTLRPSRPVMLRARARSSP